ncbi:helix-turn-helix domain-containing protein [Tepidibacter mesophilus]|uniref:helix-turn-helix domain-containing protein n=1 Tax=Tepidibacter mesophilus TaxID=655607 RepID=UPI000C08BB21
MKIGAKINRLRILNQLTQEELAQRCDLTKGFISKIERDLTSPSIATLMDILEALGTDLKAFFNEVVEEKIVYKKDDIYESVNEELKYTIHWLIPNSQKNEMEPILVDIEPGGKTVIDRPHQGQEFGYIVKGSVIIHIGNKKFKIKKGESFYFTPDKEHYIVNNTNKNASILWVSTPPSF